MANFALALLCKCILWDHMRAISIVGLYNLNDTELFKLDKEYHDVPR